MSVNLNSFSIVSFLESAEKHRCGYCKNENSSISNGNSKFLVKEAE